MQSLKDLKSMNPPDALPCLELCTLLLLFRLQKVKYARAFVFTLHWERASVLQYQNF